MTKNNRTEEVCLMNMCMIEDDNRNVLALDKVGKNYNGTTFPGGHIEKGEVFNYSVIREVKEETGLDIKNPVLRGIYHWYKNGIHNILFVYRTNDFSGELKSSDEGEVYWIAIEDLKKKVLATGTDLILRMIEDNNINECIMSPKDGEYFGNLY